VRGAARILKKVTTNFIFVFFLFFQIRTKATFVLAKAIDAQVQIRTKVALRTRQLPLNICFSFRYSMWKNQKNATEAKADVPLLVLRFVFLF
jgi:hypothetical protein